MANKVIRLFFSPRGRAPRSEFWMATITLWTAFVVLFVFLEAGVSRAATWILYPPFLWSLATLSIRRMRDRGRSPWWLLAAAIPVIGPLWLALELGFLRGTPGENQYGPDPLEIGVDYLTVK